MFDVVVENNQAVEHLEVANLLMARGIRQGFFRVGSQLKKTANQQMLERPKSGRVYRIRRGTRIVRHQASAEGETPANFTGNLRRSLGFQIAGAHSMQFGAGGRSSGVEYAKYLEPLRPLLGNSVRANQAAIPADFNREIERVMREGR